MSAAIPASSSVFACPQCQFALAPEAVSPHQDVICPNCRTRFRGALFPAFWESHAAAPTHADQAGEGEAVCFFHPENRAALSCDRCGRFVCHVCDLAVGAKHFCPTCLSSALSGEKFPDFVPWRFLWADTAFLLGLGAFVFGFMIWPFLIFTGAAAIFLALFGWKRPGSIPRGPRRWASVLGLIGGVLQIVAWCVIVAFIWGSRT